MTDKFNTSFDRIRDLTSRLVARCKLLDGFAEHCQAHRDFALASKHSFGVYRRDIAALQKLIECLESELPPW